MLKFVKSIICLVYFDIEVRKEKNVHKNVFLSYFFSIWIRVLLDTFVWGFFLVQLVIFAHFNMKFKNKVAFSSFFTKLHLKTL